MIRSLTFSAALAVFALPAVVARADDPALLARALTAADAGSWDQALVTGRASGKLASDIVEWRRLREDDAPAPFADYVDMLRRHPDWPGLKLLRREGEGSISGGEAPDLIIGYFSTGAPQTGAGSLALARAYAAKGDRGAAVAEAIRGWRNLPMADADQAGFLADFGPALADQHAARADAMLWAGELANARRMLPLLGDGDQALTAARIAVQTDADGMAKLIRAVPAKLAGSAGLAYDRFRWRIKQNKYDDAISLLVERSASATALGEPEAWAEWRRKLARKEMREGDPRRAYKLASRHHLDPDAGEDYADLEWLSGYIALRKLGDAKTALRHFDNFEKAASGPISLGRAGYWKGRALEALGRKSAAQAAYAEGARYQTSFYGLLAAEKVGLPLSPAMAGGERSADWHGAAFAQTSVFQAGILLMAADARPLASRFLLHLGEGLSGQDIGRMAGMALQAGEPYVALTLAKAAADKGVILPSAYFPLVGIDHLKLPVRNELVLSIARRESEFNITARSSAGAQGLMQVMPATAKLVAGRVGLVYDAGKLGSDFSYNARIGSAYLADLENQFGTSPLLVAAGYNAGPGRSRQWIAAFGDPRDPGTDPVDWVENIPFAETQTYVMRVAESLPIYRARISGKTGPLRFWEELKGQ